MGVASLKIIQIFSWSLRSPAGRPCLYIILYRGSFLPQPPVEGVVVVDGGEAAVADGVGVVEGGGVDGVAAHDDGDDARGGHVERRDTEEALGAEEREVEVVAEEVEAALGGGVGGGQLDGVAAGLGADDEADDVAVLPFEGGDEAVAGLGLEVAVGVVGEGEGGEGGVEAAAAGGVDVGMDHLDDAALGVEGADVGLGGALDEAGEDDLAGGVGDGDVAGHEVVVGGDHLEDVGEAELVVVGEGVGGVAVAVEAVDIHASQHGAGLGGGPADALLEGRAVGLLAEGGPLHVAVGGGGDLPPFVAHLLALGLPAGAEQVAVDEVLVRLARHEVPDAGVVAAVEAVGAVGHELEACVVVVVGLTAGDALALPEAEDGGGVVGGDFRVAHDALVGHHHVAVNGHGHLMIGREIIVVDGSDGVLLHSRSVLVLLVGDGHLVALDGHSDFLLVSPKCRRFRTEVERSAQVALGGGDKGDDHLLVSRHGLAVDFGADPLTDDFLGDAEVAVSGFLVLLARGEKACAADNGGGEHNEKLLHFVYCF